ncbi:MAG: hypothetical protein N2248_02195 [candidate division WOR-3 bacterium]|uniref:YncE family protein n=1 Tax=candidate division WOR-3 bacterium TaxID=2052148 RepID=A0A7C3IIJ5_UNCW3|nr:hypothetical protein [candidate division WOR-3 bacterium]
MKRVAVFSALLVSILTAQWLERYIYLGDSLNGPYAPDRIFYNPGNNNVFVFGDGPVVLVFDGVSGRKIARIDLPAYPAGFCYHPQANKLYVAGTEVVVIDAAASRIIRTISPGYTTEHICYNPANNRIYAAGGNLLSVIDAASDTLIMHVGLPGPSAAIACAPRVNKVYCVMTNERVAVFDCHQNRVIRTFYTGAGPYTTLYNEQTNRLYIAEGYDEDIAVVDCERDSVLRWLVAGYEPHRLCLNPVSGKFYCADGDGDWFGIYDARADTLIRWLYLGEEVQGGLVWDSVDNLVYVSLTDLDSLVVIDGVTDELVRQVPTPGREPSGLAYNPRQNIIYCAETGSDRVTFYDGRTGAVVGRVSTEAPWPRKLTYISGTDRIFCIVNSDTVFPVDCATGRVGFPIEIPFSITELIEVPDFNRVYVFPQEEGAIAVIECPEDTLSKIISVSGVPLQPVRATEQNRIYFILSEQWTGLHGLNCETDSIDEYVMTDSFPALLGYAAGRLYFAEGADTRRLVAYDVAGRRRVAEISPGCYPRSLYPLPGLNLVAVFSWYRDSLVFIDCSTHTVTGMLYFRYGVYYVIYNPVNRRLYLPAYGDTMYVVDPVLPAVVDTVVGDFAGPCWAVDTIASRIYFGAERGVTIFDCQRNRVVNEIPLPGGTVSCAFSPPNRRMFFSVPAIGGLAVIRDTTMVGVGEQKPVLSDSRSLPTVVCRQLRLPLEFQGASPQFYLADPAGRRVQMLKPGVNELGGIAPGVYFIVSSNRQEPAQIRRLIIVR